MKRVDVDTFEDLHGKLESFYEEISLLSKKNPNDAINKFKLAIVNKVLAESNQFLGSKYKPFDEFSEFNPDDMPLNSDVVFILSQYIQGFLNKRADNVVLHRNILQWRLVPEKGQKSEEDGIVYVRARALKSSRK